MSIRTMCPPGQCPPGQCPFGRSPLGRTPVVHQDVHQTVTGPTVHPDTRQAGTACRHGRRFTVAHGQPLPIRSVGGPTLPTRTPTGRPSPRLASFGQGQPGVAGPFPAFCTRPFDGPVFSGPGWSVGTQGPGALLRSCRRARHPDNLVLVQAFALKLIQLLL